MDILIRVSQWNNSIISILIVLLLITKETGEKQEENRSILIVLLSQWSQCSEIIVGMHCYKIFIPGIGVVCSMSWNYIKSSQKFTFVMYTRVLSCISNLQSRTLA